MPTPLLPRGAKPGSILLGTVEEFARQIDEADLFHVFPRIPSEVRESKAFVHTLSCPVWMKVFRKGTIRAGQAFTGRVELNSLMFTLGTSQDVKETFLHEAAHILANHYYNKECHHDWRWVRMARLLGDTGDRCHTYEYLISNKRKKNLIYICETCDQRYHRAKLLNVDRLRCGRCRYGRLRLLVKVPAGLREALGL